MIHILNWKNKTTDNINKKKNKIKEVYHCAGTAQL